MFFVSLKRKKIWIIHLDHFLINKSRVQQKAASQWRLLIIHKWRNFSWMKPSCCFSTCSVREIWVAFFPIQPCEFGWSSSVEYRYKDSQFMSSNMYFISMVIVVNVLQNYHWRDDWSKPVIFLNCNTVAFHFIFSKFTFQERFLVIDAVVFDFEFLNFTFVVDLHCHCKLYLCVATYWEFWHSLQPTKRSLIYILLSLC